MLTTGCIIARNEGALLDECIASMHGAVDEIVVIDHGSRDDTKAVAERAGARVVESRVPHHELARNAYLEATRTPWVLVLDADERLANNARAAVPRLVRDAPDAVLGFGLERFDYIGEGRWASARLVRLFRAHPQIRYFESLAHASVVPAIEALGGEIALADAPIHHLDALLISRDHTRKREGMRRRLEAEIARGGLPVMRCFLSLELFALGDDQAAERELHAAFAQSPRCEPIARLFLAQQRRARGRLDEAAQEAAAVLEGDRSFRGRASAWTVLADAHERRGARHEAIAVMRKALEEKPELASHHLNLAALLAEEERGAARESLRTALAMNPWALEPRALGPGASPSIFRQQDVLLGCVPRPDVLAARLGYDALRDAAPSVR